MAKQSATTSSIKKSDKKAVKMKKASEIKTPEGATKRTTNKLDGIKNEDERELVNDSPKTRVTKRRRLSQLKTPLAPMKMLLMKPPKIKAKKIQTCNALKKKSEEYEGLDGEGKKTKKEKSSKRAATKK